MDLSCPRCHGSLDGPYYGPCSRCRAELRATMAGEARDVASTKYEPAMHVTPNAVATKE